MEEPGRPLMIWRKAFDRVLWEVGIEVWILSVIKAMNEDTTMKMSVNGRENKA